MPTKTLSLLETTLWTALTMAVVAVGALSLVAFLARWWWVFELASHFRVQYFAILAVSAAVLLLGRRPGDALLAGSVAVVNLSLILPAYLWPASPQDPTVSYRAVLINVLQSNRSYDLVLDYLQEMQPDFVVLVEVNPDWLEELKPLEADLPYRVAYPRWDNYGVALLSRLPIRDIRVHRLGPQGRPTLTARFDLKGVPLTLIGTHPPPPRQADGSRDRNGHLSELAALARAQSGQVMVLGDLNLTPWSPYFGELLSQAGLQDSRQGFGVQATWPTAVPLLRVPIDHVLQTAGVAILNRQVGPKVGSDHLPVVVDFTLEAPGS